MRKRTPCNVSFVSFADSTKGKGVAKLSRWGLWCWNGRFWSDASVVPKLCRGFNPRKMQDEERKMQDKDRKMKNTGRKMKNIERKMKI